MRKSLSLTALLISIGLSAGAQAAPTVQVSFTNPNVTYGPNDSVPIWVTYAVPSTATEAFTFDPRAGQPWGLSPSDVVIPDKDHPTADGWYFTRVAAAGMSVAVGCSSNNAEACANSPGSVFAGNYNFYYDGVDSGMFKNGAVTIRPGQSYNVQIGTFVPKEGGAAAGSYDLYSAALTFTISGDAYNLNDPEGGPESGFPPTTYHYTRNLFESCSTGEAACAAEGKVFSSFNLTVSAVPEPSEASLMLAGLAGVGLLVARRRRA